MKAQHTHCPYGLEHAASYLGQTTDNPSITPLSENGSPCGASAGSVTFLEGEHLVGLRDDLRTLEGGNELAVSAHALNVLLARVGTELSNPPLYVFHDFIAEDLLHWRQAEAITGLEDFAVNHGASLTHHDEVNIVAVLAHGEATDHCELALEWIVGTVCHHNSDFHL